MAMLMNWFLFFQVSIVFDILFMVQHCVLYPAQRTMTPPSNPTSVSKEPLLETLDEPHSESV